MLKIAVIDGLGGGVGRQIIEAIRKELYWDIEVIALGTNSSATEAMVKAGANRGATGEYAITYNSHKVDYILGPTGIIAANAMNGEITPAMAFSVSDSLAKKLLIPLSRCNIQIAGVDKSLLLPQMIERAVGMIKILYNEKKNPNGEMTKKVFRKNI